MTAPPAPRKALPLRVLLISDGRPGHFNLSEGIIAAIARRRAVDVSRLEVRKKGWMPGALLSALTNAAVSPHLLLSMVYGVSADEIGTPQLIVSAGGNTLAANIAAARIANAPNIFYGSLRRFKPSDFALAMTSYAADANCENRLMWLKPSKLDPGSRDRNVSAATEGGEFPRNLGLIVGGNAGTVTFSERDWEELLEFVHAAKSQWDAHWTVANAPRTPDAVSDRLVALAALQNSPIAQFIDVRSAGPGTLGALLDKSEAVVCTADSSSMLSETVWMQRPVVAVAPRDFSLPENEQDYRAWMEENRWTATMPIHALTPDAFKAALGTIKPLEGNPLDELAGELQRRLPALFV